MLASDPSTSPAAIPTVAAITAPRDDLAAASAVTATTPLSDNINTWAVETPCTSALATVETASPSLVVSSLDLASSSTAVASETTPEPASQYVLVFITDVPSSAGPSASAEDHPSPLAWTAAAAASPTFTEEAAVVNALAVAESGLPIPTEVGQAAAADELEDIPVEGVTEQDKDDVAMTTYGPMPEDTAPTDALISDTTTSPCTGVSSGGLSEVCTSDSNARAGSISTGRDSASDDASFATAALENKVVFTSSTAADFSQGIDVYDASPQASCEGQGAEEVSARTILEASTATHGAHGEFVFADAANCKT